MTPDRLDACLRELGWQQPELARRLEVRLSTIRQWLSGRREIPPNVAAWLEDLSDAAWVKRRHSRKAGRANSSAFFIACRINRTVGPTISQAQKESCGTKDLPAHAMGELPELVLDAITLSHGMTGVWTVTPSSR